MVVVDDDVGGAHLGRQSSQSAGGARGKWPGRKRVCLRKWFETTPSGIPQHRPKRHLSRTPAFIEAPCTGAHQSLATHLEPGQFRERLVHLIRNVLIFFFLINKFICNRWVRELTGITTAATFQADDGREAAFFF